MNDTSLPPGVADELQAGLQAMGLDAALAHLIGGNQQQRVHAFKSAIERRRFGIVGRPRRDTEIGRLFRAAHERDDVGRRQLFLQFSDHDAAQLAGGSRYSNRHAQLHILRCDPPDVEVMMTFGKYAHKGKFE